MARGVFIRGIDERLYAEVKARAALLGITVSEAVNQALEMWLKAPPSIEPRGGYRTLRSVAERLTSEGGRGYLVVANDGEIRFLCETLQEAVERLRALYEAGVLRNSLIRPLGPKRVEFIELGGGEIEV